MAGVAFIGAGKMAEAIVRGVIGSDVFSSSDIVMSDIDARRLGEMEKKHGVSTSTDNTVAASGAGCVVFAVKPQQMARALADVSRAENSPETVYVSIAAGVRVSFIRSALGEGSKIFRVMPNLPVFAGAGASVVCGTGDDADFEIVRKLFGSVGIVEFVPEEQMDAFTALSGGGPAFVAAFLEAFISAGEKLGISPANARKFAVQTFAGTVKLIEDAHMCPDKVREAVSSPGGTTVAGLAELEKLDFSNTVENALKAAQKRSRELCGTEPTGRGK